MRRLILMRHAKSDWPDDIAHDHARPLAARGRQTAPVVAAWLASQQFGIDRVLVSNAQRTFETWELVAPFLSDAPPPHYTRAMYEVRWPDLLRLVQETPDESRCLLMIGHNPGFEDLALHLIRADAAEARRKLAAGFPAAAVAVLDLDAKHWADAAAQCATLAAFVTPRELEARSAS